MKNIPILLTLCAIIFLAECGRSTVTTGAQAAHSRAAILARIGE